jgi:hypothetical protein
MALIRAPSLSLSDRLVTGRYLVWTDSLGFFYTQAGESLGHGSINVFLTFTFSARHVQTLVGGEEKLFGYEVLRQ